MTDSHKSTAPVRRWFRFSLRTLFVVVVLTQIPLGCVNVISVINPHDLTLSAMTETSVRIGMYLKEYGDFPKSLDVLPVRPGYANRTTDGWNRRLKIQVEGDEFTLTSLGRDGVPGGTGDDADLVRRYRMADGEITEIQ